MAKRKLLYIGHGHHNKTKSTVFLVDLLSTEYEVSRFDLDPQRADAFNDLEKLPVREFDALVVFQVMPDVPELRKRISWKVGAFFPMYDYYQGCVTLDCPVWYDYAEFTIVNFSRALHEKLKACGFSSHYIQYFPKPMDPGDWGDAGSVYFWQRIANLNLSVVAGLLKRFKLHSLHLHKKLDPGEAFALSEKKSEAAAFLKQLELSESTWYESRAEMWKDILRSAIYIAPRPYEGIGMSFLEAMAAGRCVIAPDCPTMNEYITHGVNGILYDWSSAGSRERYPVIDPRGIDIRGIQRKALESIATGYENWMAQRPKILEWVGHAAEPDRVRLESFAKEIGWVDSPILDQPRPDADTLRKNLFVKDPSDATCRCTRPDITVVTVVFNALKAGRARELKQCLDSVQRQTDARIEHLIIDGASTDGTVEFVREYPNAQVRIRLLSMRDGGIYYAMNRGLWLADGKYVTFLNSDDYYHDPLGLHDAVSRLDSTLCDFSYAPIRVLGEKDGKPIDHPNAHPDVGKIFVNMEFSHQSVVLRRDSFLQIHGFDIRYRSAADYDSVLRMILTGGRACYVPRSYVTFRMGGFSCVNMARSQRESGTIFARLYNRYAEANLTMEDGLRIYQTGCFPLELKERLFRYYVSAFGSGMLKSEPDGGGCFDSEIHELLAFKHRLLPLKGTLGCWGRAAILLREACSHPLWLFDFCCRYRAMCQSVEKKEAARAAFREMCNVRLKAARRRVRKQEPTTGIESWDGLSDCSLREALPPRTRISPADFWNVYGCYDTEPWGVWAPKEMLVKVRIPDDFVGKRLIAGLHVGGYVYAGNPQRTLNVKVNECAVSPIALDHVDPRFHPIDISPDVSKSPLLDFRLSLDSDFVPAELGHSTDTRRLGISFGGIELKVADRKDGHGK